MQKGRYIHLNSEFQRIAKKDKKDFLSDRCKQQQQQKKKKKQENIRMGKTRDLFKKIRYQGNISYKDGLNKGHKWHGR